MKIRPTVSISKKLCRTIKQKKQKKKKKKWLNIVHAGVFNLLKSDDTGLSQI